jgi:putative tryptophan/tyrosine transport system substrate-binding protein
MRRREFITFVGGALLAPRFAEAQQGTKVRRVGLLSGLSRASQYDAFFEGLREFGYVEGKNITIDYELAQGHVEQLPELARGLVQNRPDVIVAGTNLAAVPAMQATKDIPIVVLASHDGVEVGLYDSLAHPGRNVTGLESIAPELDTKRLDLLKTVIPGLSRVSVLYNAGEPSAPRHIAAIMTAAQVLGLQVSDYGVRSLADFDGTFAALQRDQTSALLTVTDPLIFGQQERIARFALESKIPGVYEFTAFADYGGLMSYGPDLNALLKRGAYYVDMILKGTKPAELPVEQPTKFELVINLKTAKAFGLNVPEPLLVTANKLIE